MKLRWQPACRVHNDAVHLTRKPCRYGIKGNSRRVRLAGWRNNIHPIAAAPGHQLLAGCSPEGVACCKQNLVALLPFVVGELANGGGFACAIDPNQHHHTWRRPCRLMRVQGVSRGRSSARGQGVLGLQVMAIERGSFKPLKAKGKNFGQSPTNRLRIFCISKGFFAQGVAEIFDNSLTCQSANIGHNQCGFNLFKPVIVKPGTAKESAYLFPGF
jgi:hypothetical protein